MIRFNANLYRIATTCQSDEETRYYLKGVFVERHAVKGVTLTATDGHRLLCIHDESGYASESAIIALSPEALKTCKLARGERRDVVISTGANFATVNVTEATIEEGNETLTDKTIATSHDCRIDGTYPDWRRIVPQQIIVTEKDEVPPAFNGAYLSAMGKIGVDLAKHFEVGTMNGTTQIHAERHDSPALFLWPSTPQAFGVLMPIRASADRQQVPAWLNARPEAQSVAA